jgi:hypothetical protein
MYKTGDIYNGKAVNYSYGLLLLRVSVQEEFLYIDR